MTGIFSGELQDYEGNTIYAHTEADIVFLEDGTTLGAFLQEKTGEEFEIMMDAILKN